jgi:nucleoside-diphosphate-sugar epimerase
MKILILGATGQIGHALTTALSRTQHEVTVMVRSARGPVFPGTVRVLPHPTFSASALRSAMQGIDHVIYGIGAPEQFTLDSRMFDRVNCQLLTTFLEEFRASGIRDLTYISTYEVFENIGGRIAEMHRVADERHMTAYFQSMVRAYRSVVAFAHGNGVRLTTIHPAAVYGGLNTGDGITEFVENLRARRWHKVPFIADTRFPVVHVDSLSDAIIRSLGKPGAYIVSDHMTSLDEIARATHGHVRSYVPRTMPVAVVKLGVAALELGARLIRVKPLASAVQLDYLTKGWEPVPDKAIRELSWTPVSLQEGLRRFLSGTGGQPLGRRRTCRSPAALACSC